MPISTEERVLDRLEREDAQAEFVRRLQAAGSLPAMLEALQGDLLEGRLDEAGAVRIFEAAVFMSEPRHVCPATERLVSALGDEQAEEAREAIRDLHARVYDRSLDPLRTLYEEIDPELRFSVQLSPGGISEIVRTQAIALADHLQTCDYLCGALRAEWLLARQEARSVVIGVDQITAVSAVAQVVAPLALEAGEDKALRRALNERTSETQVRARQRRETRIPARR